MEFKSFILFLLKYNTGLSKLLKYAGKLEVVKLSNEIKLIFKFAAVVAFYTTKKVITLTFRIKLFE